MISGMAFLNGHEVRQRAAELAPQDATYKTKRDAQPHFAWLSKRTGIPVGTIHNATRETNPQTISLQRVYALASHLCRDGEDIRAAADAITAEEEKPKPRPEPDKPARERDPSSPPARKNGKDNKRGPARADDLRGVA